MPRPQKQGLDYFPYDIDLDQDDKLGMIISEFGDKGEHAFTKLLCWIYKNEGYFTLWTEEVQLKFMRRYKYCGFSLSFIVRELVPRCIKWGLFDKRVFDSFHILTSIRIQETWLDVSRKRTGRTYIPKYWLIGINGAVKPEDTELIPEVIPKGKEIKEKEIIVGADAQQTQTFLKTEIEPIQDTRPKKFIPPTILEVANYFKAQNEWSPGKCDLEAGKFFNHYKSGGWKKGKGLPVVDWQAQAEIWITNDKSGVFTNGAKNFTPAGPAKVLSKIETDINNRFGDYSRDPVNFTAVNIDPDDYDFLEKRGKISFSEDKRSEIQKAAQVFLREKKIQSNDTILLQCMKKFCVFDFFKEQLRQGKELIFKA